MKVLSKRAPNRFWYRTDRGFSSRPFTFHDVIKSLSAGARFVQGQHEFDNTLAATTALHSDVLTCLLL